MNNPSNFAMNYTADFAIHRLPGDMFQSMNGDVWIVDWTDGWLPGTQKLYRAHVYRIWIFEN